MTEAKEKDQQVIIKKYANRRLYDMSSSSYVTLEDLCDMVKGGVEFKVMDAKSGDDITRSILTQIIFEQESKGYNLLPVNFLRQIIGFYDSNISTMLSSYLEKSMEHFTANQDKMQGFMNSFNDFSPFKQLEEVGRHNIEMFEKTMNMFSPFPKDKGEGDDKK